MSWFPSQSKLFRGLNHGSTHPAVPSQVLRMKSAPVVDFDTTEVLDTSFLESNTCEFLKDIFAADANDFYEVFVCVMIRD